MRPTSTEVGLTAIGPVELKGVSQPLSLLSVRRVGHRSWPAPPHVSDRSS